MSYLHRGNPRRLSLNIPNKTVRLKLKKISHDTGPYSPDQDGPPDKTSGERPRVNFFAYLELNFLAIRAYIDEGRVDKT